MAAHENRIAMLETEIARLKGELAKLERAWERRYHLAAFGLSAIPTYFLFGSFVAAVVLVCTPALIATQTYLVGVRRIECRQLIEEMTRELHMIA
jgi:hypothetical protein